MPSPLLYRGGLYFLKSNSGVLTCLEPATGAPRYTERLDAVANVYASPVAADGRIYVVGREGTAVVLGAGPEAQGTGHERPGRRLRRLARPRGRRDVPARPEVAVPDLRRAVTLRLRGRAQLAFRRVMLPLTVSRSRRRPPPPIWPSMRRPTHLPLHGEGEVGLDAAVHRLRVDVGGHGGGQLDRDAAVHGLEAEGLPASRPGPWRRGWSRSRSRRGRSPPAVTCTPPFTV